MPFTPFIGVPICPAKPIPMSFGLPCKIPVLPNDANPPCTLSGVGRLYSPIPLLPMLPGVPIPNHPEVCRLSGDRAPPGAAGLAPGMMSGWVMCPRCNGGGDTEEMLPRLVLGRRAGPPFVLGGFAGFSDCCCVDTELRERERLREKLSLPLVVEMGVGGGRTGLGVCREVPFKLNSFVFVVVEPERFENVEREDMWEVKELTLDGSPPFMFEDALVFKANGWAEPFWFCVCGGVGS